MFQIWRLSAAGADNLGLACTEEGLVLGRTPLIWRRNGRYVVRESSEIARLLQRARRHHHQPAVDQSAVDSLVTGLVTVASALNADNAWRESRQFISGFPTCPTPMRATRWKLKTHLSCWHANKDTRIGKRPKFAKQARTIPNIPVGQKGLRTEKGENSAPRPTPKSRPRQKPV